MVVSGNARAEERPPPGAPRPVGKAARSWTEKPTRWKPSPIRKKSRMNGARRCAQLVHSDCSNRVDRPRGWSRGPEAREPRALLRAPTPDLQRGRFPRSPRMAERKKKVLVLVADGFEEIEAVTLVDVLRRADVDVTLASPDGAAVKGGHRIS